MNKNNSSFSIDKNGSKLKNNFYNKYMFENILDSTNPAIDKLKNNYHTSFVRKQNFIPGNSGFITKGQPFTISNWLTDKRRGNIHAPNNDNLNLSYWNKLSETYKNKFPYLFPQLSKDEYLKIKDAEVTLDNNQQKVTSAIPYKNSPNTHININSQLSNFDSNYYAGYNQYFGDDYKNNPTSIIAASKHENFPGHALDNALAYIKKNNGAAYKLTNNALGTGKNAYFFDYKNYPKEINANARSNIITLNQLANLGRELHSEKDIQELKFIPGEDIINFFKDYSYSFPTYSYFSSIGKKHLQNLNYLKKSLISLGKPIETIKNLPPEFIMSTSLRDQKDTQKKFRNLIQTHPEYENIVRHLIMNFMN